jgi:hypothetical protein
VARQQSLGACLAVLVAMAVQAAYLVWANGPLLVSALGRWALVVGGALLFIPASMLRASLAVDLMLFAGAALAYLLLMRASGTISTREFQTVLHALGFGKTVVAKPALSVDT